MEVRDNRQTIVLFTANVYKSFVTSEIEWLIRENPRYRIVTSASNPAADRYDYTVKTKDNYVTGSRILHAISRFFFLLKVLIGDALSNGTSLPYLLRTRQRFSLLLKCSMIADELFKAGLFANDVRCYSFFANDYALVLAISTCRGYISGYDTRVHGRDVIESREPMTRKLPFQRFKFRHARRIYGVSKATAEYVRSKYPRYASKAKVSYLGSEDNGMGLTNTENEQYVVVSVGRVRNVKRFYLIAELLAHVDLPVKWIHFGDIQENDPTIPRYREALSRLTSKTNIELVQKGFVENDALLAFYKTHYVDVLLNTSEIEGLPVSIQEAISFGIPCLATDVGGTSDVVNDTTGYLLDADFRVEEAARQLESFLTNQARNETYRQGVRKFWEVQFDASKNYPSFFKGLQTNAD